MQHPVKTAALLLILGPLIVMGALAMDIFIPFVPNLSVEFQTTQFKVQQTLNVFMFCMAIGQIIIGPLSDSYGRKKMLLISIFLYALGSMACYLTHDINRFILARGLQAIGSCGAQVITYALVRDLTHGTQAQGVYSYLLGIVGVAPITAPLLGTFLAHSTGNWRVIFLLLVAYALFAYCITLFFLKEPKHLLKKTKPTLNEILVIINNPSFKQWCMVPTLVLTGLFLFFSMSCHYVQQFMGLSRLTYSMIFSFNAILYSIASFLAPMIIQRFGSYSIIRFGLSTIIVSTFTMIVQSQLAPMNLPLFLTSIYMCCLCYGLIQGVSIGLALEPFKNNVGLASALLGSFQFLCAWAIGTLVVHPPIESSLSFALPMFLLSIFTYIISLGKTVFERKFA